jgi:hypothetical protein
MLNTRAGAIMANPTDQAIRATKVLTLARVIKRRRYDERMIMQILRLSADKAQAINQGRLDDFSTDEITRYISALD